MAKRYIDAEQAVEEARLSYCKDCNSYNGVRCSACTFDDAMSYIEDAPTADVVEVVRCKDCKHFGRDMGHGKHDCKKYEMPYCLENDYCSYGERRTDDGNL